MESEQILKLLETNSKLISEHLRTTDRAIGELVKKRNGTFCCQNCGKWKKRRLTESTLEPNSDDGRDLASAYNNCGIEKV